MIQRKGYDTIREAMKRLSCLLFAKEVALPCHDRKEKGESAFKKIGAKPMREHLEILAKARTRACSPRALATAFSFHALSRVITRACALSLATILAMPAGAIDGTATVTGGEVEFYGGRTSYRRLSRRKRPF